MRRTVLLVLAGLALLLVAGVPILVASHRRAAREDLAAVLTRHAADGHGASFVDLAALAPPTDAARQAKARAWMKAPVPKEAMGMGSDLAWRLAGTEPPAAALDRQEAFRAQAEAMAELLRPGDLCLTSLGWLPPDPASATFSERAGGFIPNLLAVRAAYDFFAFEASRAEDPAPALDTLDRLHAALAVPGGLIDAMVAVAADAKRDEIHVVLALAGALDEARLAAWLREPPRGRRLVADGLRGERLRFAAPLAQDLARGVGPAEHMGYEPEGLDGLWHDALMPWLQGPRDAALYLDAMLLAERAERGEVPDAVARAAWAACGDVGRPFEMMVPNIASLGTAGRHADETHAAFRAAVLLAQAARVRGRSPADDAEAHAWVAAAGVGLDAAAWVYEPAGEGRLRVRNAAEAPGKAPAAVEAPYHRFPGGGLEVDWR